ncbi:hypothetical protein QQS21_009456 [Conoideocrella luteorostrata]|uniref:Uncharacterized protein n=1 Tax=Conoideocrella luteorostrata TaxID=1105319 RepID=A0AAJ0CGW5_9HYPO|nr:hypothetical protein QQS21_009456 [Conoideocrella luteorostrata]
MASSPINLFFERYPRFNHSPTNEAWSEYHRMVHSLGWKEKSKREKVARKRFRVAVVEQFGQMYGTDENNLNSLQRLSEKLHISPVPDSIKSCKKAIEKVHVNIMDFVDSERTGDPVVTFKNPKRFREYTVATGKIFPKKEAKESSLLRYLLRQVFV